MDNTPQTLHRLDRVPMRKRALRLVVRGGLVALLIVAGLEGGALGVVLGVAAGAALVGIVVLEVKRANAAFERLRQRLQHAQHWSAPVIAGTSEDWDPDADDRVTGLWHGCRVQVSSRSTGVQIAVPLVRWPTGLTAERRREPGGVTTGDEGFDRIVRVVDDGEAWRCALGTEPRRLLIAICALAPAIVHERTLEISLGDADLGHLEHVLDLAAALARALPEPPTEPMACVFDLAVVEPVSGVRARHYRWLVERSWNAPRVLRVAAADPDPEISAWGASQLVPADGVFR